MEKFTPGPWELKNTAFGYSVDAPDHKPVCSPASTKGLRPEKELESNARLIAAAPIGYELALAVKAKDLNRAAALADDLLKAVNP